VQSNPLLAPEHRSNLNNSQLIANMESNNSGNVEPKRSAFKIRTKVGSQQGVRQSALMTEGNLTQHKPLTKLEDRASLVKEGKLPQSNLFASKDLTESQISSPSKNIMGMTESDDRDIVEKGDGYIIQNFKAKQAGVKTPGSIKMSRTYQYEGLEIFATRFSPDDTLLAIGNQFMTRTLERMHRDQAVSVKQERRADPDITGRAANEPHSMEDEQAATLCER
jgi:hypothetical protein